MKNQENFINHFLGAVDFQIAVDLTLDTVLSDLPEWDSLAALGVIVMFDLEYNQNISGEQLRNCRTVGDIFKIKK